MSDISKLRELLERVESATGGDVKINQEIALALGGFVAVREDGSGSMLFLRPGQNPDEAQIDAYLQARVPDYTSSIDVAVALCERVLPGAEFEITTLYHVCHVRLPLNYDYYWSEARREDMQIPLTFCAAILRAKIAMLEKEAA
jgi:hypothetical protein